MKGFLIFLVFLIICFFAFVTLVKFDIISFSNVDNIEKNNTQSSNTINENKIKCDSYCKYFDLNEVALTNGDKTLASTNYKINDEILNLKISDIKSISLTTSKIDTSVQVLFSGVINLSGTMKCEDVHNINNCNWKFTPDPTSLSKIPYYVNDNREVSFAFSDSTIKKFYPKEVGSIKKCNISINNYLIFYYPSSIDNSSDLISYSCN